MQTFREKFFEFCIIIVFALLLGIAMALVGKPGERIKGLFEDFNEVIMKLVVILMSISTCSVSAGAEECEKWYTWG